MAFTKKEIERARELLTKYLPEGTTVYYDVTSVAKSGMSRRIRFFVFPEGRPIYLTYSMAAVLGLTYKDRDGTVLVRGCGMDMGFATVYEISDALYGDGYKLEARAL